MSGERLAGVFRSLSGERKGRHVAGCKQPIRDLSPSLERQTRARAGKVARIAVACRQHAASRASERSLEPRHFDHRLRARHSGSRRPISPWQAAGAVRILGPWRESVQARSLQAVDPVVLPERVSAFPSSGRTTGSTVCPGERVCLSARPGKTRNDRHEKGHELASVPSRSQPLRRNDAPARRWISVRRSSRASRSRRTSAP